MNRKSQNTILTLSLIASLLSACAKMNFAATPTQSESAITAPDKTLKISQTVSYGNKMVDFLVVFDDSNSMLPDLQKLAAALGSFVTSLEGSGIDWQMCMTTTRSITNNGNTTWGNTYNWVGYTPPVGATKTLLKRGTTNLDAIFVNTVNSLAIGGPGSGDERAIKATFEHFKAGSPSDSSGNHCYRSGAAVSVIVVSNEDERSVGGDASKVKSTDASGSYQPLEPGDLPENLISLSKNIFGSEVRFTFNSIVVKPGDSICESQQDKSGTSPSHPGSIYAKLSNLTDGGIGSICDTNFTSSLNTFKDKIVNSMSQLTLPCEPAPQTLRVSVDNNSTTEFNLNSKTLKFSSPLIEGTKVDLSFECKDSQ